MRVGTILLTKSNKYVDTYGNLPKRPKFDKELFSAIISKEGRVTDEGYDMLPPSMQRKVIVSYQNYALVTIKELAKADLLIVTRSSEDFDDGKVFRLDKFRCLVKDIKIEIWIRSDND